MTPTQAKELVDGLIGQLDSLCTPSGFEISVRIPIEIADLLVEYYSNSDLPLTKRKFDKGEPFNYKGYTLYAA